MLRLHWKYKMYTILIYIHICTPTYIHIHTHTHTHIYIYTYICWGVLNQVLYLGVMQFMCFGIKFRSLTKVTTFCCVGIQEPHWWSLTWVQHGENRWLYLANGWAYLPITSSGMLLSLTHMLILWRLTAPGHIGRRTVGAPWHQWMVLLTSAFDLTLGLTLGASLVKPHPGTSGGGLVASPGQWMGLLTTAFHLPLGWHSGASPVKPHLGTSWGGPVAPPGQWMGLLTTSFSMLLVPR